MYNEAPAIRENLRRLIQSLKAWGCAWELIAIDDGSSDGTAALVSAVSKDYPEVRLLSHHPNRGRGYALRQGFSAARGQTIVSTEADLTWGTDILRSLFQSVRTGETGIAIASVHMAGGRMEGVPWGRRLLSRLANRSLSAAVGRKTTAVSGMTRAYRREVLETLNLRSDDKEIHLEILVKAYARGFRSLDLPAILRWPPERNARKLSGWKLLKYAFTHLRVLVLER
ncbi:MAG: glycosyltransferase family 2 protein [Candidatus Omnitrophica bacterium]|nr:glycosyltransferase family 2 protein [Candidatus Omnitrophota bacterium]